MNSYCVLISSAQRIYQSANVILICSGKKEMWLWIKHVVSSLQVLLKVKISFIQVLFIGTDQWIFDEVKNFFTCTYLDYLHRIIAEECPRNKQSKRFIFDKVVNGGTRDRGWLVSPVIVSWYKLITCFFGLFFSSGALCNVDKSSASE